MAKKDNLIKSKSIYTIRKKHQLTDSGTIFENDHVTIISDDGIYDDEMALYSDSNFKFRIRKGNNNKKRHVRGNWVAPNSDSEVWTLANVSGAVKTEESRIVNKPNYSSLNDFAYYGSATELIRATVNDIIQRFPGGISYYKKGYAPVIKSFDEKGKEATYYLVSNEFNINCWTKGDMPMESLDNPMRYITASYTNYVDATQKPLTEPTINLKENNCPNSIVGDVKIGGQTLLIWKDNDGENHLVTASDKNGEVICRPKQEIIDAFWEEMDDFERVLLNRDTTPIYKARFNTPYSNEDGYFYQEKDYVWPTVEADGNAFTPDMTSVAFQGYLESLISLAEFHDNFDSDNIWRMMTHEAIKNLDWSFVNEQDGESVEHDGIDSSRMQAMIRIYGRQFDDIKRYADNIKSTNAISYDERNNMPDYFLSDRLELDGWEAKSVSSSNDPNETSEVVEYPSDASSAILYKSGKTNSDVNIEFARRLALNSNYIQSLKGTRKGIETILGMFGYFPNTGGSPTSVAGEFDITEYVAIATEFPKLNDFVQIRALSNEYLYGDNNDAIETSMDGYPVSLPSEIIEDENVETPLVPYFNNGMSTRANMYFQSKGGWGKWPSKNINLSISDAKIIKECESLGLYEETEPYMRYADDIDEMLAITHTDIFDNMVCYVVDISKIYEGYVVKEGDEKGEDDEFSHYFILKNTALSHFLGFVDNDIYSCYGWRNVYVSELQNPDDNEDATRVLYLESLTANYEGNNPHTGKGMYDDGNTYFDGFNHLFAKDLEDGTYDYLKEEDAESYAKIECCGFKVNTMIKDNQKCYYFNPLEFNENLQVSGTPDSDAEVSNWEINSVIGSNTPSGLGEYYQDNTSVGANYAIINCKNIDINFGTNGNIEMQNFIKDVVLKYLEPMIPSTAILRYSFDGGDNAVEETNSETAVDTTTTEEASKEKAAESAN